MSVKNVPGHMTVLCSDYTPFEVMFGRKATLPIDLDLKADSNES